MRALCGLERMGVLLSLAASIFYHERLFYKRDDMRFEALPPMERHRYMELAIAIMDQPQPAAATRPSSDAAPPSVGVDGVTRPASLFEQAAVMARADGRRVLAFREKGTHDAS